MAITKRSIVRSQAECADTRALRPGLPRPAEGIVRRTAPAETNLECGRRITASTHPSRLQWSRLFFDGASMKKLFLASISLIALNAGGSALAADMPVKARPAPPPAVYSWTGCYGGGFVGYGWGESQHRSLDPREDPFSGAPFFVSESNQAAVSGDIT